MSRVSDTGPSSVVHASGPGSQKGVQNPLQTTAYHRHRHRVQKYKYIFLIFTVIVGALVLWLANRNTIRFTIVNADTRAAVTNVGVTVYRERLPLLKELAEFTDGPLMHVEKLRVGSNGVVETVGPPRKRMLSVSFTPDDSNFAPVTFTRNSSGDNFSGPGEREFIATGRANRITIALQPKSREATP